MSALAIFLLLIAGLYGLWMFLTSPVLDLQKKMKGKSTKEIEDEVKSWIDNTDDTEAAATCCTQGCRWIIFWLMGMFYSYVVEPLAVLWALTHNVGNQYVAYGILCIVGINWLYTFLSLYSGYRKGVENSKRKVTDQDGVEIKGARINEPLKIPNSFVFHARRLFFFLPTAYLLYLAITALVAQIVAG